MSKTPAYYYHLVPPEKVRPREHVALAERVAAWAAQDLGLPPLTVRWFMRREQSQKAPRAYLPEWRRPVLRAWPGPNDPTPPPYELTEEEAIEHTLNINAPPTCYGRFLSFYPTTVFVRTVRSRFALAVYLLHECRHAWQDAEGSFGDFENFEENAARLDQDAETYAWSAIHKLAPIKSLIWPKGT